MKQRTPEDASNSRLFRLCSKAHSRKNVVYYVESRAAGNKANIELSRFDGSDRFYVTNGTASTGLFYDQRSALTAEAKAKLWS